MANRVSSISCGLSWCPNTGKQTNLSIGLRITSVVLGTLAAIVGALTLFNVPGLSQIGTTIGWTSASIGTLLILTGVSLKCIKTQPHQHPEQSSRSKENAPSHDKSIRKSKDYATTYSPELHDTLSPITTTSASNPHPMNLRKNEQIEHAQQNLAVSATVSLQPLKHIDHMAVGPIDILSCTQKKIRFMVLHVLLDDMLSQQKPNHLDYLHTLVTCMQQLQNFDQNLVFAIAFYFQDKGVSLDGHEMKFQEFAECVFDRLIKKYIEGQIPQDGSQKLNLLAVRYHYLPLQNIVNEWIEKAKPLISLDHIARQLNDEDTPAAEKKLNELMHKSKLYKLDKGLIMKECTYTPLGRIMETLHEFYV